MICIYYVPIGTIQGSVRLRGNKKNTVDERQIMTAFLISAIPFEGQIFFSRPPEGNNVLCRCDFGDCYTVKRHWYASINHCKIF